MNGVTYVFFGCLKVYRRLHVVMSHIANAFILFVLYQLTIGVNISFSVSSE